MATAEAPRLGSGPESVRLHEVKVSPEPMPFVDTEIVGLQARLLFGGKFLRPDTEMPKLTELKDEELKSAKTIEFVGKVSDAERKEFYDTNFKDASFNERLTIWKEKFTEFVNKKRESLEDEEKEQWSALWGNFGIEGISERDFSGDDAQAFYDKYFPKDEETGQHTADVYEYVADGVGLYKVGEDILHRSSVGGADLQQRREWLEEIGRWSLGDVSGAVASALVDAEAAINDTETRNEFVEEVNKKEELTDKEKDILNKFWGKVTELGLVEEEEPATPVPPTEEPETTEAHAVPDETATRLPLKDRIKRVYLSEGPKKGEEQVFPAPFDGSGNGDEAPTPAPATAEDSTNTIESDNDTTLNQLIEQAESEGREVIHVSQSAEEFANALKGLEIDGVKINDAIYEDEALSLSLTVSEGENTGSFRVRLTDNLLGTAKIVEKDLEGGVTRFLANQKLIGKARDLGKSILSIVNETLPLDMDWEASEARLEGDRLKLDFTKRPQEEKSAEPATV